MILAHRIALDPTVKQRELFARAAGVARKAFNWGLEQWKTQYEAGEKPNALKLKKQFNAIKHIEFPYVSEVTKCAPEQAFINLGRAFSNFFSNIKKGRTPGYPRFKRKGRRDAFGVTNDKFCFDDKRVRLPKIGWVRCREKLRFDGKILGATVSCSAGRWFISVQVELEAVEAKTRMEGTVAGVDLGLTTFAAVFDGKAVEKVVAPKPLKHHLKTLRRAQRTQSRRSKRGAKRQSNRYRKATRRVARIHMRVSSIRNDFIHKLTTRLARNNQTVVIEDMNVKGMAANRCLARAISDVGFFEFRRQLDYKTKLYGSALVVIDRWFPSSKTCSACGAVKASLALSERTFVCTACGVIADRDDNAAKNIRTAGLAGNHARGSEGSGPARKSRTKPRRDEAGTTLGAGSCSLTT